MAHGVERSPNLVVGLIAEDPGLLADLVGSFPLPLGIGGQQVAVGEPVRELVAIAGLGAECSHGYGDEGLKPLGLFQVTTCRRKAKCHSGPGSCPLSAKPFPRSLLGIFPIQSPAQLLVKN